MAKWVTKSEYARLFGLNRSSVTKAVQAGRLPCRGDKVASDVDIRKYRRREPANDDYVLYLAGKRAASASSGGSAGGKRSADVASLEDDGELDLSEAPEPAGKKPGRSVKPARKLEGFDDVDSGGSAAGDVERKAGRSSGGSRRNAVPADDIPDEDLGVELQRARIDKLNADIAVQRQKDVRTRQNWRREDLAEFSGAFSESFAPFKNALVKLRLSAEELQNLGRAWDKCYTAFIGRLEDMELADNEGTASDS